MRKIYFAGIILLTSLFLFIACHKGSQNTTNKDTSQIIKNNIAELASNDVFKVFLYGIMAAEDSITHPNDTLNFHFAEPCLQVNIGSYDTITWSRIITLTYPASGCVCFDGNIRSGQITIMAIGLLQNLGSTYYLGLSNYSVNGIQVNGTKKIKVSATASGKAIGFNDHSELIITDSTETFSWNADHNLQWVRGVKTNKNLADDLFIYSGNSSSDSYTAIITNDLQFVNYCFWIGSGKIEISPSDLPKRQVTYPDSCLNQADVMINNETFRVNF